MTFRNQPLLWGLIGIAIPIIIHLLNRRRAAVVQWGAMRFLLASLASRNRRILLEEILLLAVRCLAVGFIALAMARPMLPSGEEPWAVALAVLPAAAALGATAAVLWARKALRWLCIGGAAALLLAAAGALARQDWAVTQRWASDSSSQDIAIIMDGSLSMTVRTEGQTGFQRAIEDARAIIGGCRPSDTVSLLVGGSSPQEVVVPGISDHKELLAKLETLRPTNGSLRVIPNLIAAGAAVAKGRNPGKKIVLITDGQGIGWDLPDRHTGTPAGSGGSRQNEERWRWLAANLAGPRGESPKVVCRLLPAPTAFKNLCADEVKFSRNVVGADRPVRIDVKVSNTGQAPSAPSAVELFVEGVPVGRQGLEEIPAGASQAVHFQHQFERPGAKTVEARLEGADDLPGDNSAFARLNVLEELPVLIVEGSPSSEPLGDASAFVQIALAPRPPGASTRPAVTASAPDESPRDLVRATVTSAANLAAGHDLGRFRVVIVAGAPLLPESAARDLAAFVQRGGGVLILPGDFKAAGDRSPTHFYDTWACPGGRIVSPARLLRRLTDLEPAVHPAVRTFAHPALDLLADPARNYSGSVLIHSYWELQVDEKDPDVRVGGRLDTAHPFLVDRRLGEGRVLLLCASLDHRQSNLPAIRPFFVPLVHELVYHLAGATATHGNIQSGQEASLDVPAWLSDHAAGRNRLLEVITPLGMRRPAQIADIEGARRMVFSETDAPGAYRVLLPPALKAASAPARNEDLFFVVPNQPQESRLDRLAPGDLQGAQKHVPIAPAANVQELAALVHGGTPGPELYKELVLIAAMALLAEIALTHWIARRRKAHGALPVVFGEEPLDIQSFRKRAREMLAVPQPEGPRTPPADGGEGT